MILAYLDYLRVADLPPILRINVMNIRTIILMASGLLVSAAYADTLAFQVPVGNEQNYFIQSEQGAFHVLTNSVPQPRLTIASPAGNAGVYLTFAGKAAPQIVQPLQITGKEQLKVDVKVPEPYTLTATVLGSIRLVRDYMALENIPAAANLAALESQMLANSMLRQTTDNWLHPEWVISADGHQAKLHIVALNAQDWYDLTLKSKGKGKFTTISGASKLNLAAQLKLPEGDLEIDYSSSYAPLTPFSLEQLLNPKALAAYNQLSGTQKEQATRLLDGLRFLAYKEKFLAGSWRFLTYFGRDSLLSLRMLTPIVRADVIEAGLHGMATHLSSTGEISHEEDLADQAYIDQIMVASKQNNLNLDPLKMVQVVNNYNMVDENYLALPLLNDYYVIGGRDVFTTKSELYLPILENVNYVLAEAMQNTLIALHDNMDAGDWRDSNSGLAFGRYSFAVNSGHIPAALFAIKTLLKDKAWNISELKQTAKEHHLSALANVLDNPKLLNETTQRWSQVWQHFHIENTLAVESSLINAHRQYLDFPPRADTKLAYPQGYLALSLDAEKKPLPLLHSDTLFMLMDQPLTRTELSLVVQPFMVNFPDGLSSDAGVLVANSALAESKDYPVFANTQYHGEVIWAWPQLMLNIAIQKQLGSWATPASTKLTSTERKQLTTLLSQNKAILAKLGTWSTSELWSWKVSQDGKLIPTAFGQSSGDNTSNADQLWSVSAVGLLLWDDMQTKK